ncbi:unnamed protein product [Bursaphelenchus okinawaensis]|uniref:Uncharacterized protein n=1 Tax=Bursaphelenchus okinawaensis TaxID=465554 RepID=A0A811L148_9BILA|nr:unnamed protein product [Bursaphelenchus okinawaensis]CAG9114210.1 unnamed protein product [Bursaphelenchus okinawaensis]
MWRQRLKTLFWKEKFILWITVVCGFCIQVGDASRSISIPIYIEKRLNAGREVYDKHSTPTQADGKSTPTVVSLSMYIEGISSFRTQTMDFQLDVYFQQFWRDSRLAHNESKRILIRDKEILHKMWLPDVYFANSRIAQFHEVTQANFLLWIEPDGSIFYDTRVSMVVICAMQLHHYPLDSQWCNLRMLSYAYDVEELVIAWIDQDPITRNPNITLPDMQIERLEPGICDGNYSTGVWSCVTAEFFVSREITHHIMQTYVPTSLIVVISWFSFWLGLDVEAVPARVSLAITTLLTLSTQANSVRTTLPEVSYMRSIDIFLTISVLFVFGVMIEFVVTNYTQRKAIEKIAARACANMQDENVKQLPQKHNSIANAKDLSSKARNFMGRIFRTYTDQKNLIDMQDSNGIQPNDTIPMRHRHSDDPRIRHYWTTTPPSNAADEQSLASWASLRRHRGRVMTNSNGQVQSVITSQPPEYDHQWREREAERLANWSRPELSCDGLMDTNNRNYWNNNNENTRDSNVDQTFNENTTSPAKSTVSGALKWTSVIRQIQKSKASRKEFGKMQAKKIDEWSRWVFPLSYLMFHIVYWSYYLYWHGKRKIVT